MKIHSETDICSVCDKPFKWSKRYWIREHELPELELITAHAGCRHKLRKLNERKEKLENELLNVEWELFNLFRKNSITIHDGEILCNGTFNIKN
jgi:hypothetical protein